jgi:hypothetical protein
MRNLKRALSLALASVMVLGMTVVGAGAANYPDVTASDNLEAINVLKAVGVMVGDENGNFNPNANVTRNEMAVIMCNLLGLTPGGTCPFTDVPTWAQPYVAACYDNGYVSGKSATNYGGNDTVTTVEAGLMVLKALGYFEYQGQFGDDWKLAVTKEANSIELFDGVSNNINEALTRNDVAQLALNALQDKTVTFTKNGGVSVSGSGMNVTVDSTYTKTEGATLMQKLYNGKLTQNSDTIDEFGRPATSWTYKTDTIISAEDPTATYTASVKGGALYTALGKNTIANSKVTYYVDGVVTQLPANFAIASGNSVSIGGAGAQTEVYYDSDNGTVTIAVINTYVAQASGDYSTKNETLTVTSDIGNFTLSQDDFAVSGYSDDDYLLLTASKQSGNWVVESVSAAKVVEDVTVTAYKTGSYVTAGGTKYTVASNASGLPTWTLNGEYNLVLDSYGNVIAAEAYSSTVNLSDYLFVVNATQNGFEYQAKVAFADGTTKTVNVAKVNGTATNGYVAAGAATANAAPASAGKLTSGWFYTFTVNSSGNYVLTSVSNAGYNASATITGNTANITTGTVGTSATVVTADGVVTTGVKNAPDVAAGPVWYLNNSSGYGLWIYTDNAGTVSTSAEELVYITNATPGTAIDANDNTYYIYSAIVNGESTTINTNSTSLVTGTGMYIIGGYTDGYVSTLNAFTTSGVNTAITGATALSYTNGTLAVTAGTTSYYVLANDVVIYTIDTTNSNAVNTISASGIKGLGVDSTDTANVYMVETSTSNSDIATIYIVLN